MYQYTDGGLRNVWLANGYRIEQTPFGEAVAFENQEGLTKAVCLALTHKVGRLTGVEVRYIRSAGMLLSQTALAGVMGIDAQTIARWEKSGKVPMYADKLLRLLYASHAEGNITIRKAVERANLVDRLIHQRIVVQQSNKGWESTVEDCEVEAA